MKLVKPKEKQEYHNLNIRKFPLDLQMKLRIMAAKRRITMREVIIGLVKRADEDPKRE